MKQKQKILAKADTEEEAKQHKTRLIMEGKLIPHNVGRQPKNYENRYIQKRHNKKYVIQKYVDKKIQHFGTYNNIEEARKERNYLESINWNYDNIECTPKEEKMKTKYKQHLYNYVELLRSSPNRKLLKTWVDYLEEINIKEGECYNKIDEFLQEHPITENKKPSTLQRYEREIRKFTEYIYQMETWKLPRKEEDKQDIKDKHSKHKTMSNTGNESTNTNEIDEEYKAFLEKYEQITRKYG